MTRAFGLAITLVVIVGAAAARLEEGASAESAVRRVIDRTVRCSITLSGGVRQLTVQGQAGVRDIKDRSKWFALAHASVYRTDNEGSFGVQAGAPKSSTGQPGQDTTMWMGIARCTPASSKIPFTTARLSGGAASQLLERYDCGAAKRIFVRIRAEFGAPTSLRLTSGTLFTYTPVKAGYLAVRTEAGKPLVYAEVFETGKARLFLAANCVRD
jgi:hypothetical protein